MANFIQHGPMCISGNTPPIDAGTLIRSGTLPPGLVCLVGNSALKSPVVRRKPSLCLNMRCSAAGRRFIFTIEVGGLKKVTARLHWPGGASGVTLGPGYDMKERSESGVLADLIAIGVDLASAKAAALGAMLEGDEASVFVQDNAKLLALTDTQQVALLAKVLPAYEAIVNRRVHIALKQHEFDALVSFAYNPGGWFKSVATRVDKDDIKAAANLMKRAVKSGGRRMEGLVKRRRRECELLLRGTY